MVVDLLKLHSSEDDPGTSKAKTKTRNSEKAIYLWYSPYRHEFYVWPTSRPPLGPDWVRLLL